MKAAKEVILITAGDPASISTEITIKAIESHRIIKNINLVAITDTKLVEEYKKLLKSNIKINYISGFELPNFITSRNSKPSF